MARGDGTVLREVQGALEGIDLARLQALIAAGADVNATNDKRWTALMVASHKGYRDVVQALIAAGANVTAKDTRGKTALVWASKDSRERVARLLRQAGAEE